MRRIISSLALALAATGGVAAVAPSVASATTAAPASVQNEWVVGYYTNYFNTWDTCHARGLQVTGNYSGNGEIKGTTNFECYVLLGDQKFSMDLYFD